MLGPLCALTIGISSIFSASALPMWKDCNPCQVSIDKKVVVSSSHREMINSIFQLAKEGKLKGFADSFTVGKSSINDVHQKWGEGTPLKSPNPYSYEEYAPGMSKGIYHIGIGRGEVVQDVRHFGFNNPDTPDESSLKISEVVEVLGEPNRITYNDDDKILTYKTGKYLLKFAFSNKGQNVDHVSVSDPTFDPKNNPRAN